MTTEQVDATAQKLAEMLQENTGRSILDSGDYYGRHWQRNQGVDFEKQSEGRLECWARDGELDMLPVVSVYHFLKDRLQYNPELDERFREWCEDAGATGLNLAIGFVTSIGGKGIYGDGEPMVINTYNGEDLLSQTLQYIYWTDENDETHVLLQIHGGCDVRGGYTDPVAFDVTDCDGTSIFDNARATIYCDDCGKHWDTDNGCHWAPDGCYGRGYKQLQDYPATDERPCYPQKPDPAQRVIWDNWGPMDPNRPEPCAGVVWVDEDNNGHCPFCGGLLHVVPWPC